MEIEECVELIKKLLFPKDVIFKFIRKSINAQDYIKEYLKLFMVPKKENYIFMNQFLNKIKKTFNPKRLEILDNTQTESFLNDIDDVIKI